MSVHSDPYREFYYITLMKELANHWREINGEGIKPIPGVNPWFGDITPQLKIIRGKTETEIFSSFTRNIQGNVSNLAQIAAFLLPETASVKAALPILLNNFFSNREKSCTIFFETLTQEKCGSDQCPTFDERLNAGKKLWIASPLKETYGNLTGKDFSIDNVKRALPVYLKAIQFLLFLQYTSNSYYTGPACNVSLSFYTFARMTGYLQLLGADARDYISKIDGAIRDSSSTPESLFAQVEEKYGEGIKKYVCDYVKDFYTNSFPKSKDSVEKQYKWTPNFLTYLANLKVELSPPDFVFKENDPLKFFYDWDRNREILLSEENADGIVNEMIKLNPENAEWL